MNTWARRIYRQSKVGVTTELPSAGTALENRYVYDSAAREIKAMAEQGLVERAGQDTSRCRSCAESRLHRVNSTARASTGRVPSAGSESRH